MRKLFLGFALWNTLVFVINVVIWPRFYAPELWMLQLLTLKSQLMPICSALAIWMYLGYREQLFFYKRKYCHLY